MSLPVLNIRRPLFIVLRKRPFHSLGHPSFHHPPQPRRQERFFSTSKRFAMPRQRLQPAEVLRRNDAWATEMQQEDVEMFKDNAAGQSPSILWLGCCDSRVPEGVVSRTKPGDMFVHRNIANQFNEQDDSANSALTYGVEALGVEHVIIVGHTSCGGVLASLSGARGEALPQSESLQRYLGPLLNLCKKVSSGFRAANESKEKSEEEKSSALLTLATEENVKAQVQNVAASKVVQANWAGKRTAFPGEPTYKVHIHGWIHNVATGKITDLGITVKPPSM